MFKRKLKKVSFIAACFLFIAAVSEGRSAGDHSAVFTDTSKAIVDSTTLDLHYFDANGLCICLPELSEEQLSEAPKVHLNKQARSFVNHYIDEHGFFLEKLKAKSTAPFQVIDEVFTNHNLPVQLKYLAVIESKLNVNASSGAGAVGLWQLMPVAARQFGLKIQGKNDERRNAYKSSVAAARCIKYLYKMFDDWLLTVAAYNSGPGRVFAAIKKSGSRNFWALQQFLPEETRNHVKKFIAMHYFFEGKGSLTTLTKAETNAHKKAVSDFIEKIEENECTDDFSVVKN